MVSVSSIFFPFLLAKTAQICWKDLRKTKIPKKRDLLEVAAIPSHTSVSVVCGGDGYSVAEIATWDPGSQSETSPWSTISWAPAHRKNPKNPSVSRLEKARYPKILMGHRMTEWYFTEFTWLNWCWSFQQNRKNGAIKRNKNLSSHGRVGVLD